MLTLTRPQVREAERPKPCCPTPLRSTRPSLLDTRFTGDPWLAPSSGGSASLCLDDYCLVQVVLSPLDVPSFYQAILRMRNARSRR